MRLTLRFADDVKVQIKVVVVAEGQEVPAEGEEAEAE